MMMDKSHQVTLEYHQMNRKAWRAKIERDMKRYALVYSIVNAYLPFALDELQPVIENFLQEMKNFIVNNQFNAQSFYTMNQLGIFFDMPPPFTVVPKDFNHNTYYPNESVRLQKKSVCTPFCSCRWRE